MEQSTINTDGDTRRVYFNSSPAEYDQTPFVSYPTAGTAYSVGSKVYQDAQPNNRANNFKMGGSKSQRQRRPKFSPYSQNQHNTQIPYAGTSSTGPTLPFHRYEPSSSYPIPRSYLPPETSMPEYKLAELSRDMWRLFHQNKQSNERRCQKMILRDKLYDIIKVKFPTAGLYVVGSSMTGLCLKNGDMDMCLVLTNSEIDQKKEAVSILQKVRNSLRKRGCVLKLQMITAKVPILKFEDRTSGIEVDLNINNIIGIRNTQLLSSYARIDQRFPALVILIKLWARRHRINDAKHQTLSSYSLVLMIIHYLQYKCMPPVLPNLQQLQPDKYLLYTDVRDLKLEEDLPDFTSDNTMDLGELFLGFLNYYGNEFDYKQNAISVRLGGIISKNFAKKSKASPNNVSGQWKLLGIEEPFERTNTARAVFNEDIFSYIIQTFRQSWGLLKRSMKLNSILSHPS